MSGSTLNGLDVLIGEVGIDSLNCGFNVLNSTHSDEGVLLGNSDTSVDDAVLDEFWIGC